MAHNLIVNQVHELGLGVSVRGVAEREIVDDELARIVGAGTESPFRATALNADAGGDAEAGLELADVHLDHIRRLVQDHLSDELVGSATGLRQVLPADHEAATGRLPQGSGADFPAGVADVRVGCHDGIRRQGTVAQRLVRIVVPATEAHIERHEALAADLELKEVRVEEAEAKRQPDPIGVPIRRCALHGACSHLQRRRVSNGVHLVACGFRGPFEVRHNPDATVLASCSKALRPRQEPAIRLTEHSGQGRGQDQKQGEQGLECQALTVLGTHAEK